MADALPSFQTFDIVAILQNREFPKEEVPFYLDEAAAFELAKLDKEANRLTILDRGEELAVVEQKIADLTEQVKSSRYVYHLTGVSNKMRRDLMDAAYAKYPKEQDYNSLMSSEKPNDERDQWFSTQLLWLMTEKIVDPNGAEMPRPSIEQIQAIQDLAPQASLTAIYQAQADLTDGARAGFERAAQDTDFSSPR